MNKRRKRGLFVLLVVLVSPVIWGAFFLMVNEAPMTLGHVIWNQEYKPDRNLDIYTANRQVYASTPVVVFIHGGAWITGSKAVVNYNRFNGSINRLRDAGYAVVSINYTLAKKGESPFPACIEDVADALNWIREHADSLNFDLHNVGLFGESAGAHLAMMVAYADVSDFTKDYVPFDFRYVVDVYGPNRMADLYRQPNVDTLTTFLAKLPGPLQAQFDIDSYLFGFDPEADTLRTFAFLDRYSPYCYADATVPPTLLIHGTRDQLVSADQTLLLRERLTELGVEHEFHLLPGVNHAFIGASAEQKAEVQRWIADFIQSHYQPGP